MKHRKARCNFQRTRVKWSLKAYVILECKLPVKGPEEGSKIAPSMFSSKVLGPSETTYLARINAELPSAGF